MADTINAKDGVGGSVPDRRGRVRARRTMHQNRRRRPRRKTGGLAIAKVGGQRVKKETLMIPAVPAARHLSPGLINMARFHHEYLKLQRSKGQDGKTEENPKSEMSGERETESRVTSHSESGEMEAAAKTKGRRRRRRRRRRQRKRGFKNVTTTMPRRTHRLKQHSL